MLVFYAKKELQNIFQYYKKNETRKNYITALREADNITINPLIEFAKN